MAFQYMIQGTEPKVDVSLFGDASVQGAQTAQLSPSPIAAAAKGVEQGLQTASELQLNAAKTKLSQAQAEYEAVQTQQAPQVLANSTMLANSGANLQNTQAHMNDVNAGLRPAEVQSEIGLRGAQAGLAGAQTGLVGTQQATMDAALQRQQAVLKWSQSPDVIAKWQNNSAALLSDPMALQLAQYAPEELKAIAMQSMGDPAATAQQKMSAQYIAGIPSMFKSLQEDAVKAAVEETKARASAINNNQLLNFASTDQEALVAAGFNPKDLNKELLARNLVVTPESTVDATGQNTLSGTLKGGIRSLTTGKIVPFAHGIDPKFNETFLAGANSINTWMAAHDAAYKYSSYGGLPTGGLTYDHQMGAVQDSIVQGYAKQGADNINSLGDPNKAVADQQASMQAQAKVTAEGALPRLAPENINLLASDLVSKLPKDSTIDIAKTMDNHPEYITMAATVTGLPPEVVKNNTPLIADIFKQYATAKTYPSAELSPNIVSKGTVNDLGQALATQQYTQYKSQGVAGIEKYKTAADWYNDPKNKPAYDDLANQYVQNTIRTMNDRIASHAQSIITGGANGQLAQQAQQGLKPNAKVYKANPVATAQPFQPVYEAKGTAPSAATPVGEAPIPPGPEVSQAAPQGTSSVPQAAPTEAPMQPISNSHPAAAEAISARESNKYTTDFKDVATKLANSAGVSVAEVYAAGKDLFDIDKDSRIPENTIKELDSKLYNYLAAHGSKKVTPVPPPSNYNIGMTNYNS